MNNDPAYPISKSDAILERLMSLHPKKIDLSLSRMERLLARLGNPEQKIPPVIHVAGTNGKGSTIATLRAIAEAAGLSVHVYTSPHLVRFNERIRLSGSLISDEELSACLEECEIANKAEPITYFEITTAAAFLAFSRHDADLCLLEVGLGGRLDATNVLDSVLASVITPVDLDHQQFLGDTLGDIAKEKAGIIKPGALTLIGPQKKDGEKSISDKVRREKAKAIYYGSDWHIDRNLDNETITYSDRDGVLTLPLPKLKGFHQVLNTGLAIATLRAQNQFHIPDAAIKAGIGWVHWPARMQQLVDTPLNARLPMGSSLWLDGGHNPAAAKTLKNTVVSMTSAGHPVRLILGMMGTKDIEGFLRPLAGLATEVIAVEIPGEEGAASPEHLLRGALEMEIDHCTADDINSALDYIHKTSDPDHAPLVVICGSLYLAGHVLKLANALPN